MSNPRANIELALMDPPAPQAGSAERFEKRWRLVGAGLSNVWRFGDLELPAASGRLLLRGQNGTGKTTALEALWPYLLDLNAARLAAGKARSTSLSSLMREGASGKRRHGHAWFTVSGPGEGTWSFGVRLQYSEGASPPVKVLPFAVPGRPLHELKLHGAGRTPLTTEQFQEALTQLGGQVFERPQDYVAHLATRLFTTPNASELETLGGRLRQIRNPSLLGEVSPQGAADALRESLPGVSEDVIIATAEALAESDATREAFTRDKEAAELLEKFRDDWSAHAAGVVSNSHASAKAAALNVRERQKAVDVRAAELKAAQATIVEARKNHEDLVAEVTRLDAELAGLRNLPAYKEAGRLGDLQKTYNAQLHAATAKAAVMCETARSAKERGESLRRELDNIIEDLDDCMRQVTEVDPSAGPPGLLLWCTTQPRAHLRAGEVSADPGPELVLHGTPKGMHDTALAWRQRADEHAHRAEAAALTLVDHKQVEAIEARSVKAAQAEKEATVRADSESARARRAEGTATDEAGKLLAALSSWFQLNHQLTQRGEGAEDAWTSRDVTDLAGAEPGQVLARADAWAAMALVRAASQAANLRNRSEQARQTAQMLREEAGHLQAEAAELRAGGRLALPRPGWAGPGDDGIALGAALDWQSTFDGARDRDLLEAALAASGLLGASLGETGASTHLWCVDAHGPVVSSNLSEALTVDAEHSLASTATAVLARIRLAPSALDVPSDEDTPGLIVGRDGTFRTGGLSGRVPGAIDPALLPTASHVGARQRLNAALQRAEQLTERASKLEQEAKEHDAEAVRLSKEAEDVAARGRSFPSRGTLQNAEASRAEAARAAREAQDAAEAARTQADQRRAEAQRAQAEWVDRTRARGLPIELPQLMKMRDQGSTTAEQLRRAARALAERLAIRLERVRVEHDRLETTRTLEQVEAEARAARQIAMETETELRVIHETSGAEIADVLARYDAAEKLAKEKKAAVEPASSAQITAERAEAAARERLKTAQGELEAAKPMEAEQLRALRTLLEVPGVADAVLEGDPPADVFQLLAQLEARLASKKTITRKTLRERADEARARLAGIWSIDPGEDHGELITYSLSHRDSLFTPPQAAAHATSLRQQAEKALAIAEEKALREFVIGRLPGAISTAWTRLHDWLVEVNGKMRSAAASSGVGVQVRMPLRDDLPPASRTVYELSCKVSDAQRSSEQQKQLREALQALLAAAPGDTMQSRVAAAIDVREWVEVHYEVTRPGGKTQRWSSRTGLSGGERRLVVLAPMLAAVAAAYDRFGEKALRLVALDEVPAEVDENGREGLARYIAELDLDLVCTSYLWDGCPGAWDGIDAYDLEAAPDSTVVAFPMLIRGLLPLPEVPPPPVHEGSRESGVPGEVR
ncbi:SbcC/MukB-like Walker B domain-containing protein [Myxococcus virescens]|uniref:Exonuclease SbcCD, C subunit n=1 Tax=Myxococcus virescens TaxID=83456 RepID=A0A511H581_9BACT|nr:SbcC/MukB-like Walker B domain-containing protein [Myxococcus virescens]GEL68675.1 hypothetical protein MVI01_04590 [Myxococcus virescens]SDE49714.1 Putative exonuclease SbcCD, C subunit [Myxococcus virescens]